MVTVYDLTNLTRRADQQRRWVVSGFDLPKRQTVVVLLGMVPGIALAGSLWGRLGQWALVFPVVTAVAALWLFNARSRTGMRLVNYQTLVDRRRSTSGRFFLYGHEVHPLASQLRVLRRACVEVQRPRPETRFVPNSSGARPGMRHVVAGVRAALARRSGPSDPAAAWDTNPQTRPDPVVAQW